MRFARRAFNSAGLIIAAICTAAPQAHAQSAQPYSVQLAVLFTSFKNGGSSSIGGTGVEPQFRLNRLYSTESFGALSLGIGGQYTSHSSSGQTLTISGLFLEPRWVPAAIRSNNVAPYLSARLAFLRQSNNFGSSSNGSGFGGGGGLAIKLTKTTNLDAGIQLVRQTFGDIKLNGGATTTFLPFTTYAAKVGISLGFPR
ncbi:MAG: outer membrane beta-barrel protein [Gemmatimonadaceae bacterium]|nr:outer membrane beta-barrel protein [Gemmatimonadaceae bacterium]